MPALQQDIPALKAMGYSDEQIAQLNPQPTQQTRTQAVENTLKAHLGSYLGGSAAIPGATLGAEIGTPAGPVGVLAGGLIGGIGGGLIGAYSGGKAQQAFENSNTYNQQQLLAQQAAEQHPYVSGAADLTAGALASGGLPSTAGVRDLVKTIGGQEMTQAAKGALLQGVLNPAIATGQSLATGQGIPSIGNLAGQALGGSLFSNTWLPHGRFAGGDKDEAGHGEANNGNTSDGSIPAPENEQTTMWNAKDEDGNYKIRNRQTIGSAFKEAFIHPYKDIENEEERIGVSDMNITLSKLPVDQKRQMLHIRALADMDKSVSNEDTSDKDYNGGEMPNINSGKLEGQEAEVPPTSHPNPPIIQTEVLQSILDKKITKPVAVQRAFPNLHLSDIDAQEALRQSKLLQELHNNNTEEETQNATAKTPEPYTNQNKFGSNPIWLKDLNKPGNEQVKYLWKQYQNGNPEARYFLGPDDRSIHLSIEPIKQLIKDYPTQLEKVKNYATGIREDEGQPSVPRPQLEGRQTDSSNDVVEKTPTGEEKSVQGQAKAGEINPVLTKVTPNPLVVNPLTGERSVVQSPLSDFNRRKFLHLKMADPSTSNADRVKYWTELEQLKNKYKGMVPPVVPEDHVIAPNGLQEHIMNNKGTTSTVLHILANTPDHPFAPLAGYLLKAMDNASRGVKWIYDPHGRYTRDGRSSYDPTADTVYIARGQASDSRTIMEEAIHSMVTRKMPQFRAVGAKHLKELQEYLKNGKNSNVKGIIQAYLKVAEHLGVHDQLFKDNPYNIQTAGQPKVPLVGLANNAEDAQHDLKLSGSHTTKYAMGNLDEFIAQAFKDHDFQRVLANIPFNETKSVWQHIIDSVRELLGMDKGTGTMLDNVLHHGTELIHSERLNPRNEGQYHILHPDTNGTGDRDYVVTHKPTGEQIYKGRDYNETHDAIARDIMLSQDNGKVSRQSPAPPKSKDLSNTPQELHLPPDKFMSKVGNITRSVIDKIHDIGTPTAHHLADRMQMALDKATELKGRWKNSIVLAGQHLTQFDHQQLMKAFNAEMATKKPQMQMFTNNAQRQFYKIARQKLWESGEYRMKIGEPILQVVAKGDKNIYLHRDLHQDPTYFPGMANQKVTNIYRANTDHARIVQLDKEFHDYNTKVLKMSDIASQERIENYKNALQGSTSRSDVSHQDMFNGNRKAMGTPLPPSFREADPVRNLERYFDRSAIDASHYEMMEKDPQTLRALGQTHDAWGNRVTSAGTHNLANNPAVKEGLSQWKLEHRNPAEHNETSLAAAVTSTFISGPPLEIHKFISNIASSLTLASNPIVAARALIHGMANLQSGYNHAIENGVVKLTARSALDMLRGGYSAAERMQSLAAGIRKIASLNDLTTKVGGGLMQAINESIIPSKILRAQRGDITAQKFLKRLDPTYDPHKIYNEQEIQQLASRSANLIHGTGDIRSLPGWMLNDSEFSGFFSLAHWSVAQTNNFMKRIYEPALRGDIQPLIMGVFGAAIGGYMIGQMRQAISGKRNGIPSLHELESSDRGLEGNPGLIGYNIIAAMQYSGFGGLLSQVAKLPFDAAYKNNSGGATFPLDEVATDLVNTLHNVQEAIMNDPNVNWVDMAKMVSQHILSTNFQLSRIAINQGINNGFITGMPAEKKELGDKMNQLRRFDMAEGLPYNDIDEASNPYMNIEQKKYKLDQNLPDAIHQLPQLISNIIQTYHDRPDVMMSKLKALKQNDYATFPSMEDTPISFFKYLGYLNREEGPQAATQEFQDYMRHKITNEVKSSVVP